MNKILSLEHHWIISYLNNFSWEQKFAKDNKKIYTKYTASDHGRPDRRSEIDQSVHHRRTVPFGTFQSVVRVTKRVFAESSFFELLKESLEIDMHWFRWNSHYGIRMSSFSFRSWNELSKKIFAIIKGKIRNSLILVKGQFITVWHFSMQISVLVILNLTWQSVTL